jgi:hypothetical protein
VSQDWRDRAKCFLLGIDPNFFFPERKPGASTANQARGIKELCSGCPVKEECLEDSIKTETLSNHGMGFRGGLSPDERKVLIRSRRAK